MSVLFMEMNSEAGQCSCFMSMFKIAGICESGTCIFERNSTTYYNNACLISFNAILEFIFRTTGMKNLRKLQEHK